MTLVTQGLSTLPVQFI